MKFHELIVNHGKLDPDIAAAKSGKSGPVGNIEPECELPAV
jgi:hypothetical protein